MPSVEAEAWTWIAVVLVASMAGAEGLAVAAVVVGVMDLSLDAKGQAAVEKEGDLVVEVRARSSARVAGTSATHVTRMPLSTSGSIDPKNLDSV